MKIRRNRMDIQAIGHRGAAGYAPENTMWAFQKGYELGADWLETDVRIAADGALVLIHDLTVDRTTDGTGRITELTFKEIQKLDAGSWFNPCYRGSKVPELIDLLDWAQGKVGVCLDLWSNLTFQDVERVAKLVVDSRMVEQTLAMSTNHQLVKHLKTVCPGITTGLLYQERVADPVQLARFQTEAEAAAKLNHPNIATIYTVEEYKPSFGNGQRDHLATWAIPKYDLKNHRVMILIGWTLLLRNIP